MAELSTKKKVSPYTAKGKECPTPSIDANTVGDSGDPGATGDSDSTELVAGKKNAEDLLNNWGKDIPATPDDVNTYTIEKYFGKGWNGNFPSCEPIAQKKGSTILTGITYYAHLVDYILRETRLGSLNELTNALIPASAMKMYGHWQELAQDWKNISLCINNFKDFRFCTENPMAVINSVDAILQNVEQAILTVDGAIDDIMKTANDFLDMFGANGEGICEKLESGMKMISEKFDSFVSKFAENISNLPQSVMNAFMNCQFIQNMFSLPRKIFIHCAAVITIVKSIRSPVCLMDFVKIISKLREAVAEVKNAATTIQGAVQQVQNIKNAITQGNWIGVLGQLNQGSGCGKQAFNIVEHPSSFAAKYPANSAYTTHGGHIVELDNTKGHERIHVQHKAGTSVELSPTGDMHSKVKKDFQLMVDGNIEINSNKKVTITGKDGVKIDYGGTTFQMDKTSMGMGGQSGNMNMDKFAVTTEEASIVSARSLTLGSALETSVSATKLLSLSSAVGIKIQAPYIAIIAETPAGITMTSAGTLLGIANGIGFASTINTVVVAAKTGMYGAGAANIIGAGVNIIGGAGGA